MVAAHIILLLIIIIIFVCFLPRLVFVPGSAVVLGFNLLKAAFGPVFQSVFCFLIVL